MKNASGSNKSFELSGKTHPNLFLVNAVTHLHHIVPRHAGGTDDPSNLVELTVIDHAIAHKVLYGLYGRWQDKLAWEGLTGIIDHEEVIQERSRQAALERFKNPEYRRRHRETQHLRAEGARRAQLGVPKSEIHKKSMRGPRPHVNQSGASNNNAKKITTPHGVFGSIRDAANASGLTYRMVCYRLDSKNHPEWSRS